MRDTYERVWLDARPHGVVLLRPLVEAAAVAALGGALLALPIPIPVVGACLLLGATALALWAVWRWDRTALIVTTDVVSVTHGTLRRRAAAVPLRAVDAVEVEQTLPARLLGYGTLLVGPLEVQHVAGARRVGELVGRLAAQATGRVPRERGGPALDWPAWAATSSSSTERASTT